MAFELWPILKSLEENKKLSKITVLTESIKFIDESNKECNISIDEYYTHFLIRKSDLNVIELTNLKSARILTKEHNEQKYPIGFRISLDSTQYEYLLHESPSKHDMLWLKSLRVMFDLIFT